MAEASEETKESKSGISRWWEFYVVRYALGTVFGALIVKILVQSGLSIPFPDGSVNEITKPEGLPLLIGYGLAYCYLASAPILVFHSARFSMQRTGWRPKTIGALILAAALTYAWGKYATQNFSSRVIFILTIFAIVMILYIIFLQLLALGAGITKTKEMWNFYRNLDEKRRVKENRELVDSYRHLREHGNAYFVVCLELLLGLGIYVAGKVSLFPPGIMSATGKNTPAESPDFFLQTALVQSLVLISVWIIPAAFVWAIGCYFEAEFANDSSMVPESPRMQPALPHSSGTESANTVPPPTNTVPGTPTNGAGTVPNITK